MINIASFDKEVKQLINIFNPINVYQLKDNTSNNSTGSRTDFGSWGPGVDLIDKEITLTKKLIIEEINREISKEQIINDYIKYVKYPKKRQKYDFRSKIFAYLGKIRKNGGLKVNKIVEISKDYSLKVWANRLLEKNINCNRIVAKEGNRVVGLYFCHSRLCPVCEYKRAELFRIKIKNRVKELIENDKNIRFSFMTLTIADKELYGRRDKYVGYKKCLSKMLAYFKRKGLIKGAVFCQENKIKNGYHLHFHILMSGAKYIRKQDIIDRWYKLTGNSYIVDIREIKNGDEGVNEIVKYATKINDISKMSDGEAELYLRYLMDNQGLRFIQGSGCFLHLEDEITKEVVDEEKREYENDESFYYWTSFKTYDNAMAYYKFCKDFARDNIGDSELLDEIIKIIENEELKLLNIFEYRKQKKSKKNMYEIKNFVIKNKENDKFEFILSVKKLIEVYYFEEKMHNVFKEREKEIINYGMMEFL